MTKEEFMQIQDIIYNVTWNSAFEIRNNLNNGDSYSVVDDVMDDAKDKILSGIWPYVSDDTEETSREQEGGKYFLYWWDLDSDKMIFSNFINFEEIEDTADNIIRDRVIKDGEIKNIFVAKQVGVASLTAKVEMFDD